MIYHHLHAVSIVTDDVRLEFPMLVSRGIFCVLVAWYIIISTLCKIRSWGIRAIPKDLCSEWFEMDKCARTPCITLSEVEPLYDLRRRGKSSNWHPRACLDTKCSPIKLVWAPLSKKARVLIGEWSENCKITGTCMCSAAGSEYTADTYTGLTQLGIQDPSDSWMKDFLSGHGAICWVVRMGSAMRWTATHAACHFPIWTCYS